MIETPTPDLPHEWVNCDRCNWAFDKKRYPGHGDVCPDCRGGKAY